MEANGSDQAIAHLEAADAELNLLLKWRCDWVGSEIKVSDVLDYIASRRNEIWYAKDLLKPKGE